MDVSPTQHVALIGFRGAGKSTIAPHLAALAGVEAFDADRELEAAAGRSIREIFAQDGEAHFRDLETKLLQTLLDRPPAVLSLGGGVILREVNRSLLRRCFTVWLDAPRDVILSRLALDLAKSDQRPSLTGLSPAEEVAKLLEERAPIYAKCADFTVDTSRYSAEEAAETIWKEWKTHAATGDKR